MRAGSVDEARKIDEGVVLLRVELGDDLPGGVERPILGQLVVGR